MIVELNTQKRTCKVTKEAGDKRYTRGYALPESGFLYDVLQALKKQGHDVIKKRMWKDGHMMDDRQQYIRTRGYMTSLKNAAGEFAIFNNYWAMEDAGEEFNKIHPGDSYDLFVIT
jgi:hypothetical protein